MNVKMITSQVSRAILSVFFIAAGVAHFVKPSLYLTMMPPWIPFPLAAIYVSGVFEILFGALVLPGKTRKLAGWGLIAVLAAVFPANIYVALHPEIFSGIPAWGTWARLPFQAVFMFWVWKAAISSEPLELRR